MLGHDRVGLGWRPELAAGILANLDRVDVVEVIADDYVDAGRRELRALRTLAIQVPLVLHGISLGLASTTPVDGRRLDGLARVVGAVEPEAWTEHLAFVPALENVATLIDPPGSDRDEPAWLAHAVAATGGELLLDLHNLHANAVNFGFDAHAALARLPLSRVRFVHVAGGAWIGEDGGRRRVLDDHRHDVPAPVFELLADLAARAPNPLTVIVERDGHYPPIERLLGELDRARTALAGGRAARVAA